MDKMVIKEEMAAGKKMEPRPRLLLCSRHCPQTGSSSSRCRQTRTRTPGPRRVTPRVRPSRPVSLTAREQETLILLAEGLSNKQIARKLSISDHGAKRLVTSILLKLGAPNRTTAVVSAIKAGMIKYSAGTSYPR